jgi:hypothetical protein
MMQHALNSFNTINNFCRPLLKSEGILQEPSKGLKKNINFRGGKTCPVSKELRLKKI